MVTHQDPDSLPRKNTMSQNLHMEQFLFNPQRLAERQPHAEKGRRPHGRKWAGGAGTLLILSPAPGTATRSREGLSTQSFSLRNEGANPTLCRQRVSPVPKAAAPKHLTWKPHESAAT